MIPKPRRRQHLVSPGAPRSSVQHPTPVLRQPLQEMSNAEKEQWLHRHHQDLVAGTA